MKHGKRKTALLAALILLCFAVLSGCAENGSGGVDSSDSETPGTGTSVQTLTVAADMSKYFADEDLDASFSESDSTIITLTGATAEISGGGASCSGGVITISAAGTYILSGTLSDGQVVVDAGTGDLVRLVLNGASVSCSTSAAIYSKQAEKTVIILADGTENYLDDSSDYCYSEGEDEPDAAVFAKGDLSITGTGSLTVNASFNNGIGTKDDLRISGGVITVNAANHAIRGRDSVAVAGGSLTLRAGNDGIQANNDVDTEKGWIVLLGGSYDIVSTHDGIQAETVLSITGGSYTITAGAGSAGTTATDTADTSDSFKGIKAGGDISISGGEFAIDSEDDCVHSNANVTISGGILTLSTGDDGVHADESLTISGGSIDILTSYEGLEGSNVYIQDGAVNIVASDDGINAAGGADGNLTGGRFGQDSFGSGGSYAIEISGGSISIVAGGDGIDSNGSITISGGYVVSLINSTPDEGALDCDGTLSITGGTVIYGGSGIGRMDTSVQSYVFLSGVTAGEELTVQKDGSELLSFTPGIDCTSLIISTPDIAADEEYEVYSGGSLIETVAAGTGAAETGFGMGGGGGGRGQGGIQPDDAAAPDMREMPADGTAPDISEMTDETPDASGRRGPGGGNPPADTQS